MASTGSLAERRVTAAPPCAAAPGPTWADPMPANFARLFPDSRPGPARGRRAAAGRWPGLSVLLKGARSVVASARWVGAGHAAARRRPLAPRRTGRRAEAAMRRTGARCGLRRGRGPAGPLRPWAMPRPAWRGCKECARAQRRPRRLPAVAGRAAGWLVEGQQA